VYIPWKGIPPTPLIPPSGFPAQGYLPPGLLSVESESVTGGGNQKLKFREISRVGEAPKYQIDDKGRCPRCGGQVAVSNVEMDQTPLSWCLGGGWHDNGQACDWGGE